jgi:hypothetical protein
MAESLKMTKSPGAQLVVMGAHLGQKNARTLWDGLESHRSIGFAPPRFSRINFMGGGGGRSNPVCTYNIYREALGGGGSSPHAPPTPPPAGVQAASSGTLSFSHLCHCKGDRGGGGHCKGGWGGQDFPIYIARRCGAGLPAMYGGEARHRTSRLHKQEARVRWITPVHFEFRMLEHKHLFRNALLC